MSERAEWRERGHDENNVLSSRSGGMKIVQLNVFQSVTNPHGSGQLQSASRLAVTNQADRRMFLSSFPSIVHTPTTTTSTAKTSSGNPSNFVECLSSLFPFPSPPPSPPGKEVPDFGKRNNKWICVKFTLELFDNETIHSQPQPHFMSATSLCTCVCKCTINVISVDYEDTHDDA